MANEKSKARRRREGREGGREEKEGREGVGSVDIITGIIMKVIYYEEEDDDNYNRVYYCRLLYR